MEPAGLRLGFHGNPIRTFKHEGAKDQPGSGAAVPRRGLGACCRAGSRGESAVEAAPIRRNVQPKARHDTLEVLPGLLPGERLMPHISVCPDLRFCLVSKVRWFS